MKKNPKNPTFIQTYKENNDDLKQLINQGKLLLETYDFQKALMIFEEIQQYNQSQEIILLKAETLFQLKRYEEALIQCDISESLGLHPNQTKQLVEKIIEKMIYFQ